MRHRFVKEGIIKMKIIVFIIFVMMVLPISGEVTLGEAVQRGLKQHELLKNHALDENLADLSLSSAKMKKWFSLEAGASYMYNSEQLEISFPFPELSGISGSGNTISGTNHNYDVYLGLSQPLFMGGVLTNLAKQEEAGYLLTQIRSELARLEFIKRIKSSYYNYQIISHQKKNLLAAQKKLTLHLRKIENLYQEELARKTDILETQKGIEEIQLKILQMDQLSVSEKTSFVRLTGIDPMTITPDMPSESLDIALARSYFEQNHPMMKMFDHRLHILTLQKKIASGLRLPQVSALSQVHYGKPGIDFFKNEWTLYFQGGIQIHLPVFKWNQLKRDLKRIDIMMDKVNNERIDFEKNIIRQLEVVFRTKKSLGEQYKRLELLVRYSQEDEEIKKKLFDERQISNIDYLAAVTNQQRYLYQKDEISARLELVKLNIDYLIGKSKEE